MAAVIEETAPPEADVPVATDVTFRIRRFLPEHDSEPHWEDYTVALFPTDRVLTALEKIKGELDGTLSFRRSCGHGICGSDAMRINGRNRLACKTLVKDLDTDKPITVEAIKGLSVEKDLIVDMEPFFAAYRQVLPFLIPEGHEPSRERLQSAEDRARFDDTTKCILCAACTTLHGSGAPGQAHERRGRDYLRRCTHHLAGPEGRLRGEPHELRLL